MKPPPLRYLPDGVVGLRTTRPGEPEMLYVRHPADPDRRHAIVIRVVRSDEAPLGKSRIDWPKPLAPVVLVTHPSIDLDGMGLVWAQHGVDTIWQANLGKPS